MVRREWMVGGAASARELLHRHEGGQNAAPGGRKTGQGENMIDKFHGTSCV